MLLLLVRKIAVPRTGLQLREMAVSVRFHNRLNYIEYLAKSGYYGSRSDFIGQAIREVILSLDPRGPRTPYSKAEGTDRIAAVS